MSGIFGLVKAKQQNSPKQSEDVAVALSRMADRLKLREWYATQTWQDSTTGVGLGQVNIGIFSTDPQPACNDEGTVVAFVFGEFYNAASLRQALQAKGYQFRTNTESELVLNLYEDRGKDLVHALQGVFVLAIWDQRQQQLILANDRYGLIPLFYAQVRGKLVFAPEVKGILQDPDFEKELNLTAVAEFFRFQRLLGDKTFFENIRLLPYGSRLCFEASSNKLSVEHYWDFSHIPPWPAGASFEEAVVETGRLLRQAIDRLTSGPERIGVYLSGGLDSRTALGFAWAKGIPVTSITYGLPGCRDVAYAEQLARRLGSDHHYFPQPDGKWLLDYVDFHLEVTEGFTTFIHAHAANSLEPARSLIGVNLTGFNGDQLLGARVVDHAQLAVNSGDDMTFLTHVYHDFNQHFSWPGITEAEEKLLYTGDFYPKIRDRAFESLAQELVPYNQFPMARRLDYFTAIHQGVRLSNLNVLFQRAFFEARYPFCDYDLLDFVYSMPVEFRISDRLYLAVVNREIPKVTWVPRDTDDMLLTDWKPVRVLHGLAQKAKKRFSQHLMPIFPNRRKIHDDPENWLRYDLRQWASGILFDQQTRDRGIFNPDFVQSIFDRHMSGREIWTVGKIAPLITFEAMLRRFYD